MFGKEDRFFRLEQRINGLEQLCDVLRAEVWSKPSKEYIEKRNDALDSDLRAEIKRLADALGYEVVVYSTRYEKKGAKAK